MAWKSKSAEPGKTSTPVLSSSQRVAGTSRAPDDRQQIVQLEQELTTARADLQATLDRYAASDEEFAASNEELAIVNEELRSTNEELQISKEKLQSLNEELTAVNNQLAAKVKELETQHADLKNLVAATDVATICLDRNLHIRWFTPAAMRVIRLTGDDSGRRISDLGHEFAQEDLVEVSQNVLRTLKHVEDEVATHNGRTFLRRVFPYRTADHYIGGVMITFVDITERKKSELAVAASEKRLRELAKSLEQQVEHRVSALKVLHDITMAANEAKTFDAAVQAALEHICKYNGWVLGHAWQLNDENEFVSTKVWAYARESEGVASRLEELRAVSERMRLPLNDPFIGAVIRSGQPKQLADLQPVEGTSSEHLSKFGFCSAVAFPVMERGKNVAVLEFFSRETIANDERFMEIMPQVGIQLGHVFERKLLEREVAVVADREQQRMGQDMHDGLSQQIAGIAMLTGTLADQLKADGSRLAARAGDLVDAIEVARTQARDLSKGLMPIEIDSHGLSAALEELTERTGKTYDIECTFDCPTGVPETDSFTATHLYRIAREAVHNAVKHAKAMRIWMRLTDDVYTMLTVRDDGVGMDVAGTSDGEGLRIMGHRANLIGATLSLENAEEGGTIVRCILNH